MRPQSPSTCGLQDGLAVWLPTDSLCCDVRAIGSGDILLHLQVGLIFGYLWGTGDALLRKRLLALLHQRQASLATVRTYLESLYADISQQVEVRRIQHFSSRCSSATWHFAWQRHV